MPPVPCAGVSSAGLPTVLLTWVCSASGEKVGQDSRDTAGSCHLLGGKGLPSVRIPGCKVMLYRLHWIPLLIHHTGDSAFIKYIAVISHLIY